MIKKVKLTELIEMVTKLNIGEGLKFYWNFDINGLTKEEIEEEINDDNSDKLTGGYNVSKLNYLDSYLLIIGGYSNATMSEFLIDDEICQTEPVERLISDYFNCNEEWIIENGEIVVWVSDKIYPISLKEVS